MDDDPIEISESILACLLSEIVMLREYVSARDWHTYIQTLSLRRQEIVSLIRDQHYVSFDFLARNFRGIPHRTLHHDLSRLMKQGYVKKVGSTRGALYTLSVPPHTTRTEG